MNGAGPVFLNGQGDGRAFLLTLPLEAKVVRGEPYSADIATDTVQTLADGNRIVRHTTGRVYRDSEGRVRREEDRSSGGPTVSITDPVAGTGFTLYPARHTAVETPTGLSLQLTEVMKKLDAQKMALLAAQQDLLSAQKDAVAAREKALAARGQGSADAPSGGPAGAVSRGSRGGPGQEPFGSERRQAEKSAVERLQDRVIEGVLASGVRRTTTIEKGAIGNDQPIKIVSEEWTSPDLQVLVMTDHNDPRTGRSTCQLLSINRGDPDPALFQVPADYTVQTFKAGPRGGGR